MENKIDPKDLYLMRLPVNCFHKEIGRAKVLRFRDSVDIAVVSLDNRGQPLGLFKISDLGKDGWFWDKPEHRTADSYRQDSRILEKEKFGFGFERISRFVRADKINPLVDSSSSSVSSTEQAIHKGEGNKDVPTL